MKKPAFAVRREGPCPIYLQLANQLRERILAGDLLPDTRLETEWQLAQDLHISRGTVRQALATLENEGLLYRIPGKGTYVRGFLAKVSNTSSLIGFMVPFAHDPLTMEMLSGAESTLRGRGYRLLLTTSTSSSVRSGRRRRAFF